MKKTKTKTLIVTETVRFEFEVPASMSEDETTLKRFFGQQADPWTGADFAAVTERDFLVQTPRKSMDADADVVAVHAV